MARQVTRLRPEFAVELARTSQDVQEAQRLRYEVFVEELGGMGAGIDHQARIESDSYDSFSEHLLLRDVSRPEGRQLVGVYRLMAADGAARGPGFYCETEYDLAPLRTTGRRLLELGRSCLHRDYRGGDAMFHLWAGLSRLVEARGIEIMFGVASFHGTDPLKLAAPLSLLHHHHLAPPELRVRSRSHVPMGIIPRDAIDRLSALKATPALIKAYLRLGGVVGDGAFVDHTFNTTDVCLILDTARMSDRQRRIYAGAGG